MKDGILKIVKSFLEEHQRVGAPLLLGFSGGPDSLALLHLLLECRQFREVDLHLAHVDHGWRSESGAQALQLAALAEKLGLPFHLKTLEPFPDKRNLEAQGRSARLAFFSELYQRLGCQALLLAHQADDQAETVFKRSFEAGSLLSLGGLKELSLLEGMVVWRPLLDIKKSALLDWLGKRGLVGIEDPTNEDPRFLRARMRVALFPEINRAFGKDATLNLARLGKSVCELKEYLQRRVAPYLLRVERREEGVFLDLSPFLTLEKIEFIMICRLLMEQEKLLFSHTILEDAYRVFAQGLSKRRFYCGGSLLIVDRGTLYFRRAVSTP